MMSEETQVGFEYFKALRAELELRINSHHYITISKIVACAALLGQLVSKGSGVSALISVPVLAFGLDVIMYHNIRRVNDIGKYIKSEIEGKVFKPMLTKDITLFEHIAQTREQGVLDIMDRFGQFVITVLFAGLAFLLASPVSTDNYWLLLLVIAVVVALDAVASYASRAGAH
jgi:hypothetical protein